MIGDPLVAAIRVARVAARQKPELFPAALDHVTDQVDRLLELVGEEAAPLRHCGQRMAVIIDAVQAGNADRMAAMVRLMEEALLAGRLERLIPVRGTPPHWLPQILPGLARNLPFTVVQGGRA